MNISEFLNYKTKCRICGNFLKLSCAQKEIQISIDEGVIKFSYGFHHKSYDLFTNKCIRNTHPSDNWFLTLQKGCCTIFYDIDIQLSETEIKFSDIYFTYSFENFICNSFQQSSNTMVFFDNKFLCDLPYQDFFNKNLDLDYLKNKIKKLKLLI